jgi:hypothetical protein
MRSTFFFIFVLIIKFSFFQELLRVKVKGFIRVNSNDLEGIYVINLKTEKSAITDKDGYFFY